jgi:hypothetical protein
MSKFDSVGGTPLRLRQLDGCTQLHTPPRTFPE